MAEVRFLTGDALMMLRTLPDESVQCCVTSPPYWGLRAYNTEPQVWGGEFSDDRCLMGHDWQDATYVRRTNGDVGRDNKQETSAGTFGRDVPVQNAFCSRCGAWRGELGLEPSPELYIAHLVEVFREVKRVLRPDATLWINVGDSYNAGRNGGHPGGKKQWKDDRYPLRSGPNVDGLKPKDLVGIPWMLAFALRADGWWLRSDIIWAKPNCMPESVRDRCTRSHEYIFMLTKSAHYFYDAQAIAEPAKSTTIERARGGTWHNQEERPDVGFPGQANRNKAAINRDIRDRVLNGDVPRVNKRDVWTIPTEACKEAHYAVMPTKLAETCIKAGSKPGDTVLDPFGGAGTTGLVALRLNRDAILIELNPAYVDMARERCAQVQPRMSLLEVTR